MTNEQILQNNNQLMEETQIIDLQNTDSDFLEKTLYSQQGNLGILIKTKRKIWEPFMGVVHITGNSYFEGLPIHTNLQFYAYPDGGSIINATASNFGFPIPKINVFFIEDNLHIWLEHPYKYNTIKVFISDQNSNVNLTDTISESKMPTLYSRLTTVIPSTTWSSSNLNLSNFATAAQGAKADSALTYRGGFDSDTDADTLETGIYSVYLGNGKNNKNFPREFEYGIIRVFSSYYAIQEAYDVLKDALFVRRRTENGWGTWNEIFHTGNLNPASFATAAQGVKADSAMQPSRIMVQSAQPATALDGDIWIKA